ncbi:unnamed protein product [Toxocara canis]|uniref:Cadherin domain-containing protein n=1 Tax=Toxocara canis TaxID=6265 RepID=A0A183VFD6_TOXCA|nr:unnamed protein product [Toxocara canis]
MARHMNTLTFPYVFAKMIRATKGAVVYRVEPEAVPFDVSPFSGDIFSRSGVPNGRYDFDVVATDRLGQEARTSVKVIVEGTNNRQILKKTIHQQVGVFTGKRHMRRRRDLGNDVVLALPEDHRLGMLNERIPLGGGERVTLAPIVKEYVTVHPNGSLELTKQLNFELQNEIHFSVQIDGPPKG